jgi:hypothetical protein
MVLSFVQWIRSFSPYSGSSLSLFNCPRETSLRKAEVIGGKYRVTFWQGELASLRVSVFWASGPKGVGNLLRIVPMNIYVAKNHNF